MLLMGSKLSGEEVSQLGKHYKDNTLVTSYDTFQLVITRVRNVKEGTAGTLVLARFLPNVSWTSRLTENGVPATLHATPRTRGLIVACGGEREGGWELTDNCESVAAVRIDRSRAPEAVVVLDTGSYGCLRAD